MRNPARGLLPLLSFQKAARFCVVGAAAVVSGCATNSQPSYMGGPSAGAPVPTRVNELQRKVEIEDDGKPAQAAPIRRSRPEDDDPTQPWSPNYGKGGTATPPLNEPAGLPRHTWPKPIETSMKTAAIALHASRRLNDAEADSVIARAISAHEMRNQ